jgi:hypothetical protein
MQVIVLGSKGQLVTFRIQRMGYSAVLVFLVRMWARLGDTTPLNGGLVCEFGVRAGIVIIRG